MDNGCFNVASKKPANFKARFGHICMEVVVHMAGGQSKFPTLTFLSESHRPSTIQPNPCTASNNTT